LTSPRRSNSRGFGHVAIISMALVLFLFLLWLGMTVIHDSAANSFVIAILLTGLFAFSMIRERTKPRRRDKP